MTKIKTVKPVHVCWLQVKPGKKWHIRKQKTLDDFRGL